MTRGAKTVPGPTNQSRVRGSDPSAPAGSRRRTVSEWGSMAHLGEANILGLAFFPESIKGADGLLDRRLLVDPVQEVRVRVESAEPLDGLVERLDRPLGGAVHPEGLLFFVPAVAELVDQEDLHAAPGG